MSYPFPGKGTPDSLTAHSVTRFAELVQENGTSPADRTRKRKSRARKTLSRIIKEHRRLAKAKGLRAVAVTLTYADDVAFDRKHISVFMDRLRDALKRLGHTLPYAWTLERASHLHYHLLLWLPRSYALDLTKLKRYWPWGTTWVQSCHNVTAYSKYMRKCERLFCLPKNARVCGYGGLDEAGKTAVQRARLPRWLQLILPRHARAQRVAGGWANTETGELHTSPYVWTPRGAKLRTP